MSETSSFNVELEQGDGYEFRVKFDAPGVPELLLDEPQPLGAGRGPNAARLVAAAVANCLSASFVFCMRGKFRGALGRLRARATARLERDPRGRFRIAGIEVEIRLAEEAGNAGHGVRRPVREGAHRAEEKARLAEEPADPDGVREDAREGRECE